MRKDDQDEVQLERTYKNEMAKCFKFYDQDDFENRYKYEQLFSFYWPSFWYKRTSLNSPLTKFNNHLPR